MTYVYKRLNKNYIINELIKDEYAKWSRDTADKIAEYLLSQAEKLEQPIELNCVKIRCEWSRFETYREAAKVLASEKKYVGFKSWEAAAQYVKDNYEHIDLDAEGLLVRTY